MKFECNRAELLDAIANVSRAASVKSALKVTEGILFRASSEGVYVCCYNFDMCISKTVNAAVSERGTLVMPIRICDIVRRLPDERMSITCKELMVHIASGQTEFDIEAMPATEFPEIPTIDTEHSFMLPQNALKTMISQTAHAISVKQDKPVYTGAMFELYTDEVHMVTLDGFRVAIRIEPTNNKDQYEFIVPGKTLNEIGKMLSDKDDAVEIEVATHNIYFCIDGYNIISRLMSGKFVNYKAFIKEASKKVRVKASALLAGVERMSLVISEANRSPVRCVFGNNRVRLSCETSMGRAEDEFECEADFPDVVIGFNNKYLVDCFRSVDTDEVILSMENGSEPVQVLPPEGSHFTFLLLPIRLNENLKK